MNVCDEASKPDVYEIEVVCRKNGITILREHTSFAASGRDEPIKAALKAAKVLKKLERKTAKQEWIGVIVKSGVWHSGRFLC